MIIAKRETWATDFYDAIFVLNHDVTFARWWPRFADTLGEDSARRRFDRLLARARENGVDARLDGNGRLTLAPGAMERLGALLDAHGAEGPFDLAPPVEAPAPPPLAPPRERRSRKLQIPEGTRCVVCNETGDSFNRIEVEGATCYCHRGACWVRGRKRLRLGKPLSDLAQPDVAEEHAQADDEETPATADEQPEKTAPPCARCKAPCTTPRYVTRAGNVPTCSTTCYGAVWRKARGPRQRKRRAEDTSETEGTNVSAPPTEVPRVVTSGAQAQPITPAGHVLALLMPVADAERILASVFGRRAPC